MVSAYLSSWDLQDNVAGQNGDEGGGCREQGWLGAVKGSGGGIAQEGISKMVQFAGEIDNVKLPKAGALFMMKEVQVCDLL